MPIALNSLMVGDWKSLLSNLGGTGPDPTLGGSAEMFALLVDASEDTEGELEPGEGSLDAGTLEEETATVGVDDVDAAEETATVGVDAVDAAEETATVGVDDVDAAEETATVGVDDVDAAEASDRACLARFLAAAFVCQPHEHEPDLSAEKNDPYRHFLIEAIAAKTSLLEGF